MSHVYALQTAGYTLIEGALDKARVAHLRREIDRLQAEDEAAWGVEKLASMGQHGALRNLADHGTPFAELLEDSPILPVLDCLLGDRYVLHSYDGLVLLPDMGRFPWDFHTDVMDLGGVAFPANATPAINCLYYLDDVTEENGATWIAPASQRSLETAPDARTLEEIAVQAIGQAGDALLFDARIWHCAGHNRSGASRRLIKTLFSQPWLRPQMDYARAVRPEVQERMGERFRYLLGAETSPPATVADLRRALASPGTS